MRPRKIFFAVLVSFSIACAGYFSIRAFQEVFTYFSLREQTGADILRWEVREVNGKFPLTAHYRFEAQEKTWQGITRLAPPWHLNEASAIQELRSEKMRRVWTAWFNPNNPTKSSLEKKFPTSVVIRAIVCCFVVLYFIFFIRRMYRVVFN